MVLFLLFIKITFLNIKITSAESKYYSKKNSENIFSVFNLIFLRASRLYIRVKKIFNINIKFAGLDL